MGDEISSHDLKTSGVAFERVVTEQHQKCGRGEHEEEGRYFVLIDSGVPSPPQMGTPMCRHCRCLFVAKR